MSTEKLAELTRWLRDRNAGTTDLAGDGDAEAAR